MVDLNSHFAGQVAELQLNTTSPFIWRYGNYTAGCFTVDTAGGNSYHRRAWTTIPFKDNVTNTLFSLTLNLNYTVSQSLSVNNINQHCNTYVHRVFELHDVWEVQTFLPFVVFSSICLCCVSYVLTRMLKGSAYSPLL